MKYNMQSRINLSEFRVGAIKKVFLDGWPGKKRSLILRTAFIGAYIFFVFTWLAFPRNYYTPAAGGGYAFDAARGIGFTALLIVIGFFAAMPNVLGDRANKVLTVAAGFLVPMLTFVSVEYLFGTNVAKIGVAFIFFNIAMIYLLCLTGTIVTGRIRTGFFAGIGLITTFSYISYYTFMMRGNPFLFSDFSNFGTGIGMLDNFDYGLDHRGYLFTMAIFSIFVLISKLSVKRKISRRARVGVIAAFCVGWGSLIYSAAFAESGPLSKVSTEFSFDPMNEAYHKSGALLALLRSVRVGMVRKPKGYSAEEAARIAAASVAETAAAYPALPADGYKRPNIIAVMDESFTDIANIGKHVETNVDPLPFYHSLNENTIKGYAYSSGYGGGTSGSEFEFLTGDSLAFLPLNVGPYQMYINKDRPSLVRVLKELGYAGNTAIHASDRFGYNRESAYDHLGFDAFLAEENFENPRYVRKYISDEAVMDKIISQYEDTRKETTAPVFLFAVTMQNHSSYVMDYHNFKPDVYAEGLTDAAQGEHRVIDKVLSLMHESDRTIGELVAYFKEKDEPTIVVFFGDHQPYLPQAYIDAVLGTGEGATLKESFMKKYRVPFFIWANYDIEEQEIEHVSINYLSSIAMKAAGMELTDFNKYLLGLYEKVPCLTAYGHFDSSGNFYSSGVRMEDASDNEEEGEGHDDDLLSDYRIIEYNDLFDQKYRIPGFFEFGE